MGCHIYASLVDGLPTLEIVDIDTQKTLLEWRYRNQDESSTFDNHEVQRLFHKLILLSCRQQAGNNRLFCALGETADKPALASPSQRAQHALHQYANQPKNRYSTYAVY